MKRTVLAFLALLLILSGCSYPTPSVPTRLPAPSVKAAGPTRTPAPSATASPAPATPTPTVTLTPTASPIPDAQITCAPGQAVCILPGHFVFRRPLDASVNQIVDPTYTYGATQNGKREPHHGIDFPNKQGTPVYAAGDGQVVVAGNDKLKMYGWVTNFYGNLVVIQHPLSGLGGTVYTLYGHLFQVNVQVGQMIKAGDKIGEVGATGIAIGSHLHVEVRIGSDDYHSTRNPELWLIPLPGTGTLAGRVLDAQGNPGRTTITIEHILGDSFINLYPLETYAHETLNGDDVWHENFSAGDLPAGNYRLSLIYDGVFYAQVVQVQEGKLTLVTFNVK